ncbi:MAG: YraN family protein [Actinomycetota bacterium]|nr:YraN family protein [Actinomycetota bacterium]
MSTDPRQHLGRAGERLAAEHLQRRGYRILERNYRTRWGELDIIALDRQTIVFCEVKTRRMLARDRTPLEAVHTRKRSRVRRMAGSWLAERKDRPHVPDVRFDAIGVTFDASGRLAGLEHLQDAF